jgi:thioredoxin reductase/Pyruvate/2-oxoacid:ferredoxin oxidoreductase delta subunit
MDLTHLALYLSTATAVVGLYMRRQRRIERHYRVTLSESVEAGLTDPVSLHPVVDPARCLGMGDCARACPEGAIGVIDGKAQLVDPSVCIGHGACAATCEHEAIRLVFGTERRGVDIPQVSPKFETNVPGIFIAGELGGMGLIRKAAEQGRQAMEAIGERARRLKAGRPSGLAELDVVIVGAGPAGLAASLAAKEKGLEFVALEQEDTLGGAILHFPRNKIAMTAPMQLPIVGKVRWREISKEALLEFWSTVLEKTRLPVHFGERMIKLRQQGSGFLVVTPRGEYRCKSVLLSIGRRGSPRRLGVPGESSGKVVYRLTDPQQYRGRRVLVVGGGDSALEAVLALSAEPETEVTLSYRGTAFSRVKRKNRQRFQQTLDEGYASALMGSVVTAIGAERVALEKDGRKLTIRNDIVIVCAGGELPTGMLREIGVMVETHYGTHVKRAALEVASYG